MSREIDKKFDNYYNYLETVSPTERPHIQFMIHNAKLMKNKLTAMLAELDVLIAENNLKTAVEQLETFKKDHSKGAEIKKSSSPILESAKTKTQKQLQKKVMSSTDMVKNDTAALATGKTDKENTKPVSSNSKKNRTTQDDEIPDKGTKRRHSDSSRSDKHCEKKQKRTHRTDINPNKSTNSNKSTHTKNSTISKNSDNPKNSSHTANLLRNNMSPVKKTNRYITQGVQTCKWLEQVKTTETCRRTNSQRVEDVPHRMLDEDECTVILEDQSVKAPKTHKDAISVSKALQQIMSPKTDLVKAKNKVTEDLTQRPVSASMKILFEDEPENVSKRSQKVKSECLERDLLNNSSENLVNELYKDILEAKRYGSRPENCSYAVSSMGNICKNMLRDILTHC